MGKVIFNEIALGQLIESIDGPVGREMERRAQKVVAIARDEVAAVMWRAPNFAQNVDYAMEGSTAVIGFLDQGPPDPNPPTYNYLANKEIREGRFLEHALWIAHEG